MLSGWEYMKKKGGPSKLNLGSAYDRNEIEQPITWSRKQLHKIKNM